MASTKPGKIISQWPASTNLSSSTAFWPTGIGLNLHPQSCHAKQYIAVN
jgi:hypothetical protein